MPTQFSCLPQQTASLISLIRGSAIQSEVLASELIWAPLEPPAEEPSEELREQIAELVQDLEENEDCLRVWTSLD
jgi:translational activator of cytochrome c oxidase 1